MSLDEQGLKIEPVDIEIEYITFEEQADEYIIEENYDSNQENINAVERIDYEGYYSDVDIGNLVIKIDPEPTTAPVEKESSPKEEKLSNFPEIVNALNYINERISSDFNKFKKEYTDSFTCTRCRRVFDTKRGLSRHTNNCINDFNFCKRLKSIDLKCDICDETFKSEIHFSKHIKTHSMKCMKCGMVFIYRRSFERHSIKCKHISQKARVKCNKCEKSIIIESQGANCNNSKCNKCKKTIKSEPDVSQYAQCKKCEKPIVSKTGVSWLKCNKCEKPIKTEPKILNDVQNEIVSEKSTTAKLALTTISRSPQVCSTSLFSPSSSIQSKKSLMKNNAAVHLKEHSYNIDYINKNTTLSVDTNNQSMNNEVFEDDQSNRSLQKPNKTPSLFVCEICEHVFRNERLFNTHMVNHSDSAITCTVCKKKFKKKKYLTDHMKYIHSNEHNYECDMCGKTFKTKAYIALHLKIVNHNEAICDKCGETFVNNYRLSMHNLKQHPPEKTKIKKRAKIKARTPVPYPCDMCGKMFKSKILLSAHVKNTNHITSFQCDACGREFNNKLKYVCHKRTHDADSGDTKCGTCGKTFKLKLGLKRHTNIYRGKCNTLPQFSKHQS